jgi:hypothetical protein
LAEVDAAGLRVDPRKMVSQPSMIVCGACDAPSSDRSLAAVSSSCCRVTPTKPLWMSMNVAIAVPPLIKHRSTTVDP